MHKWPVAHCVRRMLPMKYNDVLCVSMLLQRVSVVLAGQEPYKVTSSTAPASAWIWPLGNVPVVDNTTHAHSCQQYKQLILQSENQRGGCPRYARQTSVAYMPRRCVPIVLSDAVRTLNFPTFTFQINDPVSSSCCHCSSVNRDRGVLLVLKRPQTLTMSGTSSYFSPYRKTAAAPAFSGDGNRVECD